MTDNASLLMEWHGDTFPAWFRMKFVEPGTLVFLVHKSILGWFEEITPSNFGSADCYLGSLGL